MPGSDLDAEDTAVVSAMEQKKKGGGRGMGSETGWSGKGSLRRYVSKDKGISK